MVKHYEVSIEFYGDQSSIRKNVYPLISPIQDPSYIEMDYLLKRLKIKPKDSIEIDKHDKPLYLRCTFVGHLMFTVDTNTKKDRLVAIDFIHEIYRELCKNLPDIDIGLQIVSGMNN